MIVSESSGGACGRRPHSCTVVGLRCGAGGGYPLAGPSSTSGCCFWAHVSRGLQCAMNLLCYRVIGLFCLAIDRKIYISWYTSMQVKKPGGNIVNARYSYLLYQWCRNHTGERRFPIMRSRPPGEWESARPANPADEPSAPRRRPRSPTGYAQTAPTATHRQWYSSSHPATYDPGACPD